MESSFLKSTITTKYGCAPTLRHYLLYYLKSYETLKLYIQMVSKENDELKTSYRFSRIIKISIKRSICIWWILVELTQV